MNELTGGLIHMTAHMVVTESARGQMIAGAVAAVVFGLLALIVGTGKNEGHKWRYFAAFLALALLGVTMIYSGNRAPRRKEIYCCASGPVSLEQVATRYDILEVDGSFIKLAER